MEWKRIPGGWNVSSCPGSGSNHLCSLDKQLPAPIPCLCLYFTPKKDPTVLPLSRCHLRLFLPWAPPMLYCFPGNYFGISCLCSHFFHPLPIPFSSHRDKGLVLELASKTHFSFANSHFLSTKPRSKLLTHFLMLYYGSMKAAEKSLGRSYTKSCTSPDVNLIIEAPHCLPLSLRICWSASYVSIEIQIQQAFTEHLLHARMFIPYLFKSTIWDGSYHTHSIQEKIESSKIKGMCPRSHKTSQSNSATQFSDFKTRIPLIIKWYQFFTSELFLLCLVQYWASERLLNAFIFALHSCFWASKQSHVNVQFKTALI